MNALLRLVFPALLLALLALPARAEDLVTSEDILKQLDKKPEPAPGGATRSFRGIRITGADQSAPQQPANSAPPSRETVQAPPREAPSATVYLYFKSGSAELADEFSRRQLAAVAKALSAPALASARFEIGGHTDSHGSDQLNQTLSEQRAAHIRELLVGSYGMNPSSLSARGYGKSQPVAGNDTDAGRAKNRRVVIKRLD